MGKILTETLLNCAALLGVVCLGLVIVAFVAGITLIMFRTGSMSPTIPAGSLAVVQQIPASEIAVGDVVTVDRAGQLPVTHRVTSVNLPADPAVPADTRVITMRGDANDVEDPFPYTVNTVRKVLLSIPGLAYVVVWFSQPLVLGACTLGATALVTATFWPRSPGRSSARRRRYGR